MKRSELTLTLLFLVFVILLYPFQVFAQGGENSSSLGVSGQKPLSFLSITLEDGSRIDLSEGIALSPKFKLTFDKNVVHMLIWENNSKCFSLVTEKGENIPVRVAKIDDTVDSSQKQNIFVQPVNQLKPETTYYLKISPDLKAKNESYLGVSTSGKGITITFKTKNQAEAQGAKSSENKSEEKKPEMVNRPEDRILKMFSGNWPAAAMVLLIILWITIEVLIRKKNAKKWMKQ